MAKKNDFRQKHPIKMLIYIAAVIALLACILVMVLHTRKKREEYESQITSLSQNETEYIRPERTTEAESETETEAAEEEEETKDENAGADDFEEESDTEEDAEEVPEEEETEEETEEDTEEETEEIQADLSVLVLNGTGVEGVAGYWASQMEEDGYENVISASYEEEAEEETVIYVQERSTALPFQAYFQESRIRIGEITEGILMSDGEEEPDEVDVYIIVGKADARSE